jgi:hypothetical protein
MRLPVELAEAVECSTQNIGILRCVAGSTLISALGYSSYFEILQERSEATVLYDVGKFGDSGRC